MKRKRRFNLSRFCYGKIPYENHSDAMKAAKSACRREGHMQKPYLCMECGKFHLSRMRQGIK